MAYAGTICSEHGCPNFAVKRGRCNKHLAAHNTRRAKNTPTNIDRARPGQRRRRAEAVRQWRAQHGDWCPGYKREPHAATDLTAEHIAPVADTLTSGGVLTVLCRSCNSRHGAETKAFYYGKPV
ncbi:MAG: hypothetical protein HLX46_11490 [Corynebacterium sp.]|uniref:hypothetical protein n=1 Tax=Corynebacterium sp. TaxID=1720 RepID=UPI001830AA58|nr:hypothetical protein [Corynebacterium sp.]NWO17425.1 hypothetical protein [Corynebacterium sp.]